MMRSVMLILVLCAWSRPGFADETEKIEFFELRIRPVLAENCYSCHSAAARVVKGGLLLDSREGLMLGGDSGPALVPGNSRSSLILDAMRHVSLEMPPDRKLPDHIIDDFSTWIQNGAVDPRSSDIVHKKSVIDLKKGREFWSFRAVQRPPVPLTDDLWAATDIDRLIAAQQQSAIETGESVARAPQATPDVLIRRLTYVLTGLPPTLAEQETFTTAWTDNPDAALETTVDRLLQSLQFAERWGRHWLDIARFSESTGGGRSLMLPDAWRFRDYVIQSFINDKPFNQLVREHISGDLLPSDSDAQHDEQLVGVGYLMLGAINYEEQDKDQLRMDVVDEQIDSMGRTFLGMTLGCCRCHDHKFDPIPTTDYYALAGIFRSTTSLLPNNVSDFVTAPLKVGFDKAAFDQWTAEDRTLEAQIDAMKKSLAKENQDTPVASKSPIIADAIQFIASGKSPLEASTTVDAPAEASPADNNQDAKNVAMLERQLKQLEAARTEHKKLKPETPIAMCVRDDQKPADWHVHIRGEIRNLGVVVPRGFINVATPRNLSATLSAADAATSSGRRELAAWIASTDNPLTARVYVNRVWMHVMGEGIVRTPDNFGEAGDRPTHPELLDYLADTFIAEDHWSTKKLVRRLCLTSQFQLSSDVTPDALSADPENRLLARASRRRLDAEAIRDSLLQISGALDLSVHSGCTIAKLSTYDNEYHHEDNPMLCRSVYVPSFRNTMLDLFEVFDVANPNVVAGNRTNSLRPAQSLYMLNSPFVMEQSQRTAVQFMDSAAYYTDDSRQNIRNAWRICLGRDPSRDEATVAANLLNDRPDPQSAWAALFHSLFASVDFRYID